MTLEVKIHIGGDSKDAEAAINRASKALNDLGKEVKKSKLDVARDILDVRSFQEIDREIAKVTAAFNRLKSSGKLTADELSIAFDKTQEKIAKLNAEKLLEVGKNSKKSADDVSKLADAFNGVKSAIAGFVGVTAFAALGKDILNTNRSMEMLRAQLDSVTGSAEAGARAFDFVQKFAKDTPFEIDGLTQSFISLRNFGIEPTKGVMDAMTNQAAKLGAKQETLASIVLQLGQAYQKGKLQQEDMVVLAERGVPIYELTAKALNKTGAEIAEMSSKGEIGRDAIDAIIKKMGELSEGSNARAMDTLNGKISNLSDAWHQFEDTLLQDKSEGLIKSIVESATASLELLRRELSSSLDDQIATIEQRLKFRDFGVIGKATYSIAALTPFSNSIEEDHLALAALKKQKAKQDAANNEADAKSKSAAAFAQTQAWLDDIDAESTAKAVKNAKEKEKSAKSAAKAAENAAESAAKAYAKEREEVAKSLAEIQRETSLIGLSNTEVQRANELHAALAKAKGDEVQLITAGLEAKWKDIDANDRQAKQWAQMVDDANAYVDLRKEIDGLARLPNLSTDQFSGGIGKVRDSLDAGTITSDQAKAEFDKLGKAYNDSFIQPAKDGTEMLSEFSVQAAHNMQSSFADFLFDPFQDGLGGMVEGFAKALRRMVAEAAAAQIFNGLLGKDFSKTGDASSGLLAGLGTVIVRAFSGGSSFQGNGPLLSYQNKHSGGIAGTNTGQSLVSPWVFNGAPHYHGGGIAGLKPNEVPSVLLKGEEVLTEDNPRHVKNFNGSGGGTVIVYVNNMADGTRASATSKKTDQGTQIDVIIEKIEQAISSGISRGTGIAPALEKQYGLNRAAGSF